MELKRMKLYFFQCCTEVDNCCRFVFMLLSCILFFTLYFDDFVLWGVMMMMPFLLCSLARYF